jgi:hypothetical protein
VNKEKIKGKYIRPSFPVCCFIILKTNKNNDSNTICQFLGINCSLKNIYKIKIPKNKVIIAVKLKFVNDISYFPQNKGTMHITSNCAKGELIIVIIYLSISPNTISCVPITVTKSANIKPFVITSKPCKCKKPGAFILHL